MPLAASLAKLLALFCSSAPAYLLTLNGVIYYLQLHEISDSLTKFGMLSLIACQTFLIKTPDLLTCYL